MLPYLATIAVLVMISSDRLKVKLNAPACLAQPSARRPESPPVRNLDPYNQTKGRHPMRYQSFTKLAAVALAAAAIVAAPAAVQAKTMKVGFVYVGPIGDHGWSYQHHQGLLAVQKAYGDKVQTTHVEKVAEGPDSERVIRQLAQQGHEIIFTTSFGFMNRQSRSQNNSRRLSSNTIRDSSGRRTSPPTTSASTKAGMSRASSSAK